MLKAFTKQIFHLQHQFIYAQKINFDVFQLQFNLCRYLKEYLLRISHKLSDINLREELLKNFENAACRLLRFSIDVNYYESFS